MKNTNKLQHPADGGGGGWVDYIHSDDGTKPGNILCDPGICSFSVSVTYVSR